MIMNRPAHLTGDLVSVKPRSGAFPSFWNSGIVVSVQKRNPDPYDMMDFVYYVWADDGVSGPFFAGELDSYAETR